MKRIVFLFCIGLASLHVFAQKQTYDVVSYTLPKDWQQQQIDGGLQLSITDNKTRGYALALITSVTASTASAIENFTNHWNILVKGSVTVNSEPTITDSAKENGWDIISGNANYTDGSNTGMATLITATANGQTVSTIVMTNTKQFQADLLTFLNSLELAKPSQAPSSNSANTTSSNKKDIAGLWVFYNTESGGVINGIHQLTGGYMRREYLFNADGTYIFRAKDWMVYVKDILFIYETGTYTVTGNQIIITPSKGSGEWWSKSASNRTSEWGKLVRSSTDYKLEKATYTFELTRYAGNQEETLFLRSEKPTARDGKDGDNKGIQEFRYTSRDINNSLIDNPPGFKTWTATNSPAKNSTVQQNNTSISSADNVLAGKIWEAKSAEKFINGTLQGYNTGGYFVYQYKFNTDDTYQFIYIGASAYIQPNLLQYETGTYSVSGNALTIVPTSGSNEEWSVIGGPINLAGMSDVSIGKIKHNWGQKIKTEKRTLEKITYTISTEYWAGNNANALKLEWNGEKTIREGKGNFTFYLETAGNKSAILPSMFQVTNKEKTEPNKNKSPVNTNNSIDFAGTWISRSSNNKLGTTGYIENEYIFNNDGSYNFYSKTFSQSVRNLILIKEKGTFTVSGKLLTLKPASSTTEGWSKKNGIDEFGKLLSSKKNNLEQARYQFTKYYFEGIQEWNLVLQANAPTKRDGPFSANTTFNKAWYYAQSSANKPSIKLP